MFQRNALNDLRNWAQKQNRKPLIIRGARQVGKTSLINEFGKEFDLYLTLNLDKKMDSDFFAKETSVNEIFESILVSKRLQKPEGRVLLFIDEIQNSVNAVKMLRYFYEEMPGLYVIAAGSLLETLLNKHISFPVGRVEYMAMRPCTFSEFLGAMGELPLQEKLTSISVSELMHPRLIELFKQYALIGGMPEVIENFVSEKDLIALESVYQTLLTGYQDDVEKYAPRDTLVNILRHVIKNGWEYAAQRITFEKFANSNYKSRDMAETFRTLEKALLLELVYPTTEFQMPITKDLKKKPKLMWLDTGLVNYASGIQVELFNKEQISDTWRGRIAEHIVGQEIIGASIRFLEERNFWVREARNSQAELDFLINSREFGLIPVEVKSGDNSKLKSLQLFMMDSSAKLAIRFWNNFETRDIIKLPNGKEFTLFNLPFYYAGFIEKYLAAKL
jgi:predicted AAA+ superfamily ATPase